MATPSIKYTLVFCLIALALFHVHDCADVGSSTNINLRADKGYAVSKDTAKDCKSNEYGDEKRKQVRQAIRFCKAVYHDARFEWCCMFDASYAEDCFNGEEQCKKACL